METLTRKYKTLSLALGIVVAITVGVTNPINAADTGENNSSVLSSEDYEVFQEYFERTDDETGTEHTYVFYDTKGELLYQFKVEDKENIKDVKLRSLLIEYV